MAASTQKNIKQLNTETKFLFFGHSYAESQAELAEWSCVLILSIFSSMLSIDTCHQMVGLILGPVYALLSNEIDIT